MNKLTAFAVKAAGTGFGLFAASLVVYYFNLDMRLIAKVKPLLEPVYDRIERRPMLPPEQ